MVAGVSVSGAPDAAAGRYCRIAFLDRERKFLAGDPGVANRHSHWTGDEIGHVDPDTGMLVLDLRHENGALPAPPGTAWLVAHFAREVLRDRMDAIGVSYGLSANQTSFLEALVRLGGIREAADDLGISYTTARNLLAEVKAKTGFTAIAQMVAHMLELVSGTPEAANDPADRHDLFGLSDRQFAIACGLATAFSRRALAERLGISEAVVKAELKDIFLILGVQNAGQLVRKVVEARLSIAGAGLAPESPLNALPESTLHDASGRIVAWSDFGPAEGRPVFIVHSSITARAPPTRLVAALQARGFRPLAIDRPGFGGTTPAPRGEDTLRLAVRDFRLVCEALGIARADVIARSAGQQAVILGAEAPELIGRMVLVNPTPHIDYTTNDRGPLGAVKRRFIRNPAIVERMIRLLSAYATPRRMKDGMIRSFRGSPPDEAMVEDPRFVADYLRASRGFADGHIAGYVAEQVAWSRGEPILTLPGRTHWRVLLPGHFFLHDPAQSRAYWERVLPDTPILTVPEAGQMLAYSHPERVVAALID